MGCAPESQVRSRLAGGGRGIRTLGLASKLTAALSRFGTSRFDNGANGWPRSCSFSAHNCRLNFAALLNGRHTLIGWVSVAIPDEAGPTPARPPEYAPIGGTAFRRPASSTAEARALPFDRGERHREAASQCAMPAPLSLISATNEFDDHDFMVILGRAERWLCCSASSKSRSTCSNFSRGIVGKPGRSTSNSDVPKMAQNPDFGKTVRSAKSDIKANHWVRILIGLLPAQNWRKSWVPQSALVLKNGLGAGRQPFIGRKIGASTREERRDGFALDSLHRRQVCCEPDSLLFTFAPTERLRRAGLGRGRTTPVSGPAGRVPSADVAGAYIACGTSRAVHCYARRDQPKAARNRPLYVGALGAPDGLEAPKGLALVFKPQE